MLQRIQVGVVSICVLLMCATVGTSQKIPGNVMSKVYSSEEDLESTTISDDGKYAIIEFTDQIWGISIADGKTVWTRKLKDEYKRKGECIEWINPHEATIPTEAGLEWIDVETGKSLAIVPFLGEGLSELAYQAGDVQRGTWPIEAKRLGYIMLVPFDNGYQIFDLKARKELYRSTEELDLLRIEYWGTTVFIHGDMDTGLIVDIQNPRILVKHSMEGEKIDWAVYQNLFRYKNQIAVFTEENAVCYSAETGKRIGILGFDPEDMDSYSVVLLRDSLCFLAKNEEFLRLYNAGSAKLMWSSNAGMAERGLLAYAWPLPDGNLLAEFVNSDDEISLVKFDASTGTIKWEKRMVQSSGEFESGHRFSTSVKFSFGTTANVPIFGYRPVIVDSIGRQTYYSQVDIDSARPFEEWEFVSVLNSSIVHEASKGVGILRYLGTYGNEILVKSSGNVRKAWDGKISENDYDAEGVIRIDAETGKVKAFTPVPFVQHLGNEDANVTRSGRPSPTENGTVILGTHTVVLIRTDGVIDTVGFPVKDEGSLDLDDFGKDYVTIDYEDEDEKRYEWKVVLQPNGIKKELLGVSDTKGTFAPFSDTTFVPVSLRFIGGKLEGYPVMSEIPKQWPKPLWTITSEQLEKIGLEDVIDASMYWNATGVIPYKDVIYILGGSGLGVVDPKTGCFNSIAWEGYNSKVDSKVDLKRFGYKLLNGAVFDLGDDVGIVKVGPGCELKLIGYTDEDRTDLKVVYSTASSTLMIVDQGQNKLDVYQIK